VSGHPALVLTYHSIAPGPPPLHIAADRLAAQLDLLSSAGLEPVSLAAIVESLERDRELPRPSFSVTFDDAYRNFAETALPILERRGVPATLFVTASADRAALAHGTGAPLLALAELAALAARGVEIGAHSISHIDLTALGDDALRRELALGREILERHAGRPVEHLAYPLGRFDARVRAAAAQVYRSAWTTQLRRVPRRADRFALPRVDAHSLRSPLLRWLVAKGRPDGYLRVRRWLRRLRGSEPRRGAVAT